MLHEQYYDINTARAYGWRDMAAPSPRYPYGLGLDNDDFLATQGIYPYREERPDYDALTQELAPDVAPVLTDGWMVLAYHAQPLPSDIARTNLAQAIRTERDLRIAVTDYLMSTDYPLSDDLRTMWTMYRQALRDITGQPGFPWNGPGDPACPWPDVPQSTMVL